MQTMSLNEVCKLLKITEQTGRNRLSSGMPMPPNFRVGRRRLFIAEDVHNWIAEKADNSTQKLDSNNHRSPSRGRPTKASIIESKR